jgi:hypothetical protein
MGHDDEKKVLMQHNRPPTEEELDAFKALCLLGDQVVLAPILLNGEERFALARLATNALGEKYLQVLGFVVMPSDVIQEDQTAVTVSKSVSNKKHHLN